VWCFKNTEKFIFLFFYFWLGLLFCRLLWGGLGELVLVMERNHGCSMDALNELCESNVLLEDWCGAFRGVKGCGEKKVI
jgi:hypothetical protein